MLCTMAWCKKHSQEHHEWDVGVLQMLLMALGCLSPVHSLNTVGEHTALLHYQILEYIDIRSASALVVVL